MVVDYLAVEDGQTLIKSENKKVLHRHPMIRNKVVIPVVLMEKVCIVTKSNNPHLKRINCFLKVELLDKLYFIELVGWR